jgi:hypothetical protein
MQGTSIDQEIGADVIQNVDNHVDMPQQSAGMGIDFGFIKAKTGEGTIEEYLNHPLNFNSQKSTARIIRGFSGMFGSLDLAIIDIAVGIMDMMKSSKNKGVSPVAD